MRYIYGMRLRGFRPGTFPKDGFIDVVTDTSNALLGILEIFEGYHDFLVYDRELSEEELRGYELDFLFIVGVE